MLEMFICKCVDILQDMTDKDIKTVLQKAKKTDRGFGNSMIVQIHKNCFLQIMIEMNQPYYILYFN